MLYFECSNRLTVIFMLHNVLAWLFQSVHVVIVSLCIVVCFLFLVVSILECAVGYVGLCVCSMRIFRKTRLLRIVSFTS